MILKCQNLTALINQAKEFGLHATVKKKSFKDSEL